MTIALKQLNELVVTKDRQANLWYWVSKELHLVHKKEQNFPNRVKIPQLVSGNLQHLPNPIPALEVIETRHLSTHL